MKSAWAMGPVCRALCPWRPSSPPGRPAVPKPKPHARFVSSPGASRGWSAHSPNRRPSEEDGSSAASTWASSLEGTSTSPRPPRHNVPARRCSLECRPARASRSRSRRERRCFYGAQRRSGRRRARTRSRSVPSPSTAAPSTIFRAQAADGTGMPRLAQPGGPAPNIPFPRLRLFAVCSTEERFHCTSKRSMIA